MPNDPKLAVPRRFMELMKTLETKSVDDAKEVDVEQIVLVTAADKSHFQESKDSIASAQKNFPKKQIIFYDLGLKAQDKGQVGVSCVFNVTKAVLNYTA